jgi:predicted small secreted protein
MKKTLAALMGIMLVLALLLTGCSGGIGQDVYDAVSEQLGNIQSLYDQAQSSLSDKAEEIDGLKSEIADLKALYELVGETNAETVANIARFYHETHQYSTTDLFVCGDMAAEVWNMLKAQGINAVVVVG